MRLLLETVTVLINIYILIIFAQVIMSWLLVFNVVNVRNWFVMMVTQILYQLTEPVYKPVRGIFPDLGPIDITPIIIFLLLAILRRFVVMAVFALT